MKFSKLAAQAALVSAAVVAAVSIGGPATAQVTPQNPSGPVKGATQTLTSPEGLRVQVSLADLKARIFPPLAGDNKSRLAYVDGNATARILATGGNTLENASIEVGYLVACGVHDGGFESWIGTNQSVGATVGGGAAGALGGPIPAGAIGGIGLVNGQLGTSQNQVIKTAPGTVTLVSQDVKAIKDPKAESFGIRFKEKRISVSGCIGSVDAVAYATVKVSSRSYDDAKTAYSEIIRLA